MDERSADERAAEMRRVHSPTRKSLEESEESDKESVEESVEKSDEESAEESDKESSQSETTSLAEAEEDESPVPMEKSESKLLEKHLPIKPVKLQFKKSRPRPQPREDDSFKLDPPPTALDVLADETKVGLTTLLPTPFLFRDPAFQFFAIFLPSRLWLRATAAAHRTRRKQKQTESPRQKSTTLLPLLSLLLLLPLTLRTLLTMLTNGNQCLSTAAGELALKER
jgi:hypothetical protein